MRRVKGAQSAVPTRGRKVPKGPQGYVPTLRRAIIGSLGDSTEHGTYATVYLLATFTNTEGVPIDNISQAPPLVQHFHIPIYPPSVNNTTFPHLHTGPAWRGKNL